MPNFVDLGPGDAGDLARLLTGDEPEYGRYFVPFPSKDADALAERLGAARQDRYWGMREQGTLVGFFMLRGFDEGYARPSFGVYVARAAAGQGLARRALAHAIDWCVRHDVARIMLKVHPENAPALKAYCAAGFEPFDTCLRTGHIMMQKELR